MRLEFLVEYTANLKPAQQVGAGPYGNRRIIEVTGGSFEGPQLKGEVLPGGGDWLVVRPDGVIQLDVRATFQTSDGALIYVSYLGLSVSEGSPRAAETDYGQEYFMTAPRFETGDERYAWLNRRLFVGEGRRGPGRVSYRVYEVANG